MASQFNNQTSDASAWMHSLNVIEEIPVDSEKCKNSYRALCNKYFKSIKSKTNIVVLKCNE